MTQNDIYNTILYTSANILLDVNMTAKVGDFGFAKEVPKLIGGRSFYSMKLGCGTPGYTAPELLNGELSPKADVYSFGVVSWIDFNQSMHTCGHIHILHC